MVQYFWFTLSLWGDFWLDLLSKCKEKAEKFLFWPAYLSAS